ncbi:hypothetical protein Gotur_024952 [Gossypium turneri]
MKRLAVGPMTTLEYNEWWVRRINDNTPKSSQGNSQSIEEHVRVVPSELEIIRQDFERRNEELEKKIEQMEEEKMNLRLDLDVQKLEAEKLRKGKNKAEEDLYSLKIDYKKLHLSIRTAGLGKTSEHEALEKSLSESQKEKCELKDTWSSWKDLFVRTWKQTKIVIMSSFTTFRIKLETEIILWEKLWFRFER